MRIVDGFLLKTIADQRVVVPLGTNTVSFRSIITTPVRSFGSSCRATTPKKDL